METIRKKKKEEQLGLAMLSLKKKSASWFVIVRAIVSSEKIKKIISFNHTRERTNKVKINQIRSSCWLEKNGVYNEEKNVESETWRKIFLEKILPPICFKPK